MASPINATKNHITGTSTQDIPKLRLREGIQHLNSCHSHGLDRPKSGLGSRREVDGYFSTAQHQPAHGLSPVRSMRIVDHRLEMSLRQVI